MTRQAGYSLIELMISLVLGLIITAGVIQVFVGTRATNSLNQAIAEVQEYGRYITWRLQDELREVGRYDLSLGNIDRTVDLVLESSVVLRQPVALANDYAALANLGSKEGSNGESDELVVNLLAQQDCTGNRFGTAAPAQIHIVNRYFVAGTQLKCIGYNGRNLRGLMGNPAPSSEVVLLDNVESMQIEYGISDDVSNNNAQVVRYVDASQLPTARLTNQQVVAIRLAVLIQSMPVNIQTLANDKVRLLSETPVTLDNNHYYQVFTVSVALRNSLNHVGGSVL
ncbi:MAG: PilW family protein [Alteromonadaceae bacterium]|nr:PilW family protein [Alteromonadaceae bacterium]